MDRNKREEVYVDPIPAIVIQRKSENEYVIRYYTNNGIPNGYGIGWLILNQPRLLESTGQLINMASTLDEAFAVISNINYNYCYYNDMPYYNMNSWMVYSNIDDSEMNLITYREIHS